MDSSLDAERALLGAMLTDPEGRQHVLGFVQPDDFYRPPPMASHAPAYAGIVIGASLRRRLTVCGGRLRQVGQISGQEVVEDLALENARLLVSGERLAAGACHRRRARPFRRQCASSCRCQRERTGRMRRSRAGQAWSGTSWPGCARTCGRPAAPGPPRGSLTSPAASPRTRRR